MNSVVGITCEGLQARPMLPTESAPPACHCLERNRPPTSFDPPPFQAVLNSFTLPLFAGVGS